MVQTYVLQKSSRASKKFMIITPEEKKIHFGAKNYEDYTIHKNEARKYNYINRHSVNEDWSKRSIDKPMFWAKHILWNKETLEESIKDTERRFNIKSCFEKLKNNFSIFKKNLFQ